MQRQALLETTDIADIIVSPTDPPALCECGTGLPKTACCAAPRRAAPADAATSAAVQRLLSEAAAAAAAGDRENAARLYIECLIYDPRQRTALSALANIRQGQQDLMTATALRRRLVGVEPSDPRARAALALLLIETEALPAAELEARACLRLSPHESAGHKLMGLVFLKRGRAELAEYHYRQALRMEGASAGLLSHLAASLAAGGKYAEARAVYAEARGLAPPPVGVLLSAFKAAMSDADLAEAAALLDAAIESAPDDPDVLLARARLLVRTGPLEAALDLFDAYLDRHGLRNLNAAFEKGRLLDRLGRFDEAFAMFTAGREELLRKGHHYRADMVRARVADQRAFFVRARMDLLPRAATAVDQPQPIFILGFPRSGTTLVEQILSSHTNIAAGDELPLINELVAATGRLLNSPLPYPAALTEVWMADRLHGLNLLRDDYLRQAAQRGIVRGGEAWFTDKMPLNEIYLGLICLVFPASPRIHLIRHPLDVVLSAYSHWMTFSDNPAATLADAATHYVLAADLMEHYRSELGPQVLTLRYEDLIDDAEREVRRMLDHIGVAFDERCLRFEENPRRARTPSSAAVREKLNDRARFRYRNYLRHLTPAIEILRPTIERLGYTI